MYKLLTSLFLAATSLVPAQAISETVLMMAEEPGCIWCARWDSEIGTVYSKTGEGDAAPLRRVNIQMAIPDDISLARGINFTPTFVLLIDGQEAARLEGYPGEDFFWGLLGKMLTDNDIAFEIKGDDPDGEI